jgi:hypothetical protein
MPTPIYRSAAPASDGAIETAFADFVRTETPVRWALAENVELHAGYPRGFVREAHSGNTFTVDGLEVVVDAFGLTWRAFEIAHVVILDESNQPQE